MEEDSKKEEVENTELETNVQKIEKEKIKSKEIDQVENNSKKVKKESEERDENSLEQAHTSMKGNAEAVKRKHSVNEEDEQKEEMLEEDDEKQLEKQKKRRNRMRIRGERGRENVDFDDSGELVDNEKYSTWVPPENQSGDGSTTLNDKYGY